MTPCEQTAAWIDAWLDSELSHEDAARLTAHCVACDACRRALDGARALQRDLNQLAAVAERIVSDQPASRVTQEFKQGNRPSSRTWAWRVAAALALATTIALATLPFKRSDPPARDVTWMHPLADQKDSNPAALVVADAEEIVLSHSSHTLAVQYATQKANVQVVWLYEARPGEFERSSTTAPGT